MQYRTLKYFQNKFLRATQIQEKSKKSVFEPNSEQADKFPEFDPKKNIFYLPSYEERSKFHIYEQM